MNIKSRLSVVYVLAICALCPVLLSASEAAHGEKKADAHSAAGSHTPQSVDAEGALWALKGGNKRFVENKVSIGKPVAERRIETGKSQHPFAIIVGCADSRTPPETIFDQTIGDLFVIRTAGNLVDEYALGSIEYAVHHLGTRLVVVMGHERCGAVSAAIASPTAHGNVNAIVRDIQPAVDAAKKAHGDKVVATIYANTDKVVEKIKTQAQLGEFAHLVKIVPAYYDLDTGEVIFY